MVSKLLGQIVSLPLGKLDLRFLCSVRLSRCHADLSHILCLELTEEKPDITDISHRSLSKRALTQLIARLSISLCPRD